MEYLWLGDAGAYANAGTSIAQGCPLWGAERKRGQSDSDGQRGWPDAVG